MTITTDVGSAPVFTNDLIYKVVYERMDPDAFDQWHELDDMRVFISKLVIERAFFDGRTGHRFSVIDREAVYNYLIGILAYRDTMEEYLRNNPLPSPFSLDPDWFDGTRCCDWAKQRYYCRNPDPCGCISNHGWECDTPEYHGSRHRSCARPEYCVCKCGHPANQHAPNIPLP
jgi:hypothetical protein